MRCVFGGWIKVIGFNVDASFVGASKLFECREFADCSLYEYGGDVRLSALGISLFMADTIGGTYCPMLNWKTFPIYYDFFAAAKAVLI